ncbi:MAG: serine protease [Acholeplasmataceae bacterium]|jgi:S1-C subfamily serine protease|nr:serine protease [Acholeplasmataceae bacterium]
MKKLSNIFILIAISLLLASCQGLLNYELEEYAITEMISSSYHAHFDPSIETEDLINELSLETMQSNVTVFTTVYTPILMFRSNESRYFGSGVIFFENDLFYYVLTNEHVASLTPDTTTASYTLTDYQNNEIKAYLYEGSLSVEHDLAVLFFEKSDKVYPVIDLNQNPLSIGDQVIAVGQPEGQKNTITFGEVEAFTQTNVKNRYDETISRDFLAIKHTAYVNSGSSGGMLLNYNLELVGINFAGAEDEGNHVYTFSIPVSIILEYFEELINA